ncbi:MAG: isoprenylcysteine carboxylmethyltransferase family protein [Lentisphaeria bacterium]|nr:isoprenylcysteine carboxylmethyltransferase family protein [Candidatus Neomarinimicrobiota bacterium]MCF7842951.1 isoprenylcysteine carboxylmethyltransferase family protein [Lentisphaeria bacterium]
MVLGIVFIIGSLLILWVSWSSLSKLHSHGYPRFFVFEAVLGLFVLNVPHWFTNPFSLGQIVSWLLLMFSVYLVLAGFYLLRTSGQAVGDWECTTNLIEHGIFRHLRHPMYASLFYLTWGIVLKNPAQVSLTLGAVATVFVLFTIRNEELENRARFGNAYEEYMRRTKRLIPGVF